MYLLLSHLFPDAGVMKMHVMPQAVDHWTGHPDCPEMLKAQSALAQSAELPIIPGNPDNHDSMMSQLWTQVTGTIFRPISAKDCLTEAVCTPQPLPKGFTRELFDWAMYKSLKAQQMKYAAKPVVSKVLASRVLFDLQDTFRSQTDKDRQAPAAPLTLVSSHDTTLIQLLVAMDLWDGQWPTYAETIILEAYQATSAGKVENFFRLLRRGKPLEIPACGGSSICPADVLYKLGMPMLRDPDQMDMYCLGQLASDMSGIPEVAIEAAERRDLHTQESTGAKVNHNYYSIAAALIIVAMCSALSGFALALWLARVPSQRHDCYIAIGA
jgi:hypothetical protein